MRACGRALGSLVVCVLLAGGCVDDDGEACERTLDIDDGPNGRLLVTTTDFSSGWLSIVDVETRTVETDVALSSTDAIPFFHEGRVYLVHRHGHDFIDVFEPDSGWSSQGQYKLKVSTGTAANPQSLAFADDGLGFITLYGAPELLTFDFDSTPSSAQMGSIDLSAFADADGIPEAGISIAHGGRIYIVLHRLDQQHGFARVDDDLLVAVDGESRELVDLDPGSPAIDGLVLPGQWARQWRRDPADETGATVAMLTTGILQVDLDQPSWSWAVDEAAFAAVGIADRLLPQSFDIDHDGTYWLAAYTIDFDSVRIFRAEAGGLPVEVAVGLHSVERSLEIVGDELWYGDTTLGEAGMRVYAMGPGARLQALSTRPLCTGLDPYTVIEFP